MKISTEIHSAARFVGEERAIELYAKAGFDGWDFSMFNMANYDWKTRTAGPCNHPLASDNYAAFAKKLRQIGLDNGIVCNQSHAPFPVYCKEIRDLMKRAIECTAIAGGEVCVIHPDNFKSAEENAEMYLELLPFAKEHGVKMAAENMWCWDDGKNQASAAACSHHEDFLAHIKKVNDPYLVACLDIGHAEMRGLDTTAVQMIETLGNHLAALHIHDNDLWHDSHKLPFTMGIDFDRIVHALKKSGYNGWFTLETDQHLPAFGKDKIEEGIAQMAEAAHRLVKMFDEA